MAIPDLKSLASKLNSSDRMALEGEIEALINKYSSMVKSKPPKAKSHDIDDKTVKSYENLREVYNNYVQDQIDELTQQYGVPKEEAYKRLHGAGLIPRLETREIEDFKNNKQVKKVMKFMITATKRDFNDKKFKQAKENFINAIGTFAPKGSLGDKMRNKVKKMTKKQWEEFNVQNPDLIGQMWEMYHDTVGSPVYGWGAKEKQAFDVIYPAEDDETIIRGLNINFNGPEYNIKGLPIPPPITTKGKGKTKGKTKTTTKNKLPKNEPAKKSDKPQKSDKWKKDKDLGKKPSKHKDKLDKIKEKEKETKKSTKKTKEKSKTTENKPKKKDDSGKKPPQRSSQTKTRTKSKPAQTKKSLTSYIPTMKIDNAAESGFTTPVGQQKAMSIFKAGASFAIGSAIPVIGTVINGIKIAKLVKIGSSLYKAVDKSGKTVKVLRWSI